MIWFALIAGKQSWGSEVWWVYFKGARFLSNALVDRLACFLNQYKEKQIVYQEVRVPKEEPSTAPFSLTCPAERSARPPLALAPWDCCSLSFLSLPRRRDFPLHQPERAKEEVLQVQDTKKAVQEPRQQQKTTQWSLTDLAPTPQKTMSTFDWEIQK